MSITEVDQESQYLIFFFFLSILELVFISCKPVSYLLKLNYLIFKVEMVESTSQGWDQMYEIVYQSEI